MEGEAYRGRCMRPTLEREEKRNRRPQGLARRLGLGRLETGGLHEGGGGRAYFDVEFVIAKVEGGIDRLEGFEVDGDFLLLPVVCYNRPAVDDQAIRRRLVIQLEP